MIAGAAHQIVQAGAFAAEDDHQIAGKVELVVCGRAVLVETDDPEVAALEVLKCADKIDDAGDTKVLGGSGARFDSGGRERSGAALGKQDAVNSGPIGNAQESAKVLRVFNAVECEKQASSVPGGETGLEKIFERKKFLRADERDNALMC
jgi:hypothetical protein